MLNNINSLSVVIMFTLITSIYTLARPPRPNPNFVWVPKHRIQMGVIIPGHWEYRGKKKHKRKKSYKKNRDYRKYIDRRGGFKGVK